MRGKDSRRRAEWSNSSSNLSDRIRPPRALKRPSVHLSIEPQATININGLHVFSHCKPLCFVEFLCH